MKNFKMQKIKKKKKCKKPKNLKGEKCALVTFSVN